jgi:hypothetical protein
MITAVGAMFAARFSDIRPSSSPPPAEVLLPARVAVPRSAPDCPDKYDRADILEKVATEITGHRTRKTFERYHIVSNRDIREVSACGAQELRPGVFSAM